MERRPRPGQGGEPPLGSRFRPGDILNKPGSHVMLFTGFADTAHRRVRVIEATGSKVMPLEYAIDELSASGYQARRDARRRQPRGF